MIVVVLALVSMVGAAQNFRANLDESVKPGDDFWEYAVGSWLKANPLDKEHPMNGAFVDLEELNKKHINALIMGCSLSSGLAFSQLPTAYCQKLSPGFTLSSRFSLKFCAAPTILTKASTTTIINFFILPY